MLVDGKKIAEEIYVETAELVRQCSRAPRLTAVTCAPNFETQRYLNLKKQKAAEVGIALNIVELPENATTEEVVTCVERVSVETDGVVVQLPMPSHIDREAVLQAVPKEKDPDGFLYETSNQCLPPVVGAIAEIATRYDIEWSNKKVAIVGHGRLVGRPADHFARLAGAEVTVLTEESADIEEVLKRADIVISGVGKPHFITPEMVKEGVVIFDAGTSEDGGVLVGDVHSDVSQRATLFTPVPGGIGPITVALLLRNLAEISGSKQATFK